MATYDLEEQEQIEELKTWWKVHGALISAVVVALSVAVVGWQGWQWWDRTQSAQASQLYGELQRSLVQQDAKRVRLLAGELIDKYSGTAYAGMAAMLSGKVLVDAGDLKSAQAQLGWAAENAKDPGLRDLARLRQAIVLAEDKAYDEALKRLAVPPAPTFKPRYFEVQGDILTAQGKLAEARSAYDEAIKLLPAAATAGTPYREILEAKRDSGGVS